MDEQKSHKMTKVNKISKARMNGFKVKSGFFRKKQNCVKCLYVNRFSKSDKQLPYVIPN